MRQPAKRRLLSSLIYTPQNDILRIRHWRLLGYSESIRERDRTRRVPGAAQVSARSVTPGESRVHASLDPMTLDSRHDDADADISIALQLSSSSTLNFDSFTASLSYTRTRLAVRCNRKYPTTRGRTDRFTDIFPPTTLNFDLRS